MDDRLARARRDYLATTGPARRAFAEACAAADEVLDRARAEATGKPPRIAPAALDAWRAASNAATKELLAAIAPAVAEVTAAIEEARASGTSHMEVAP